MIQHTPGPWRVSIGSGRPNSVGIRDGAYRLVAEAHQLTVGAYDDLEANARLIAKAPEMLALLQAFVDMYPPDNHFVGTFDKARALLREIEGN